MEQARELASWLLSHRLEIERAMNAQLGLAAPAAGSAESEALRRYRSFLCTALVRGETAPPALDGLRLNERRVLALIDAWTAAASRQRGEPGGDLATQLAPYRDQFRVCVRQTTGSRQKSGRPRATRRAVVAAIDRVGDAFLAIDTDGGEILDANPAAGALLGTSRDALLGVDSTRFVPEVARDSWWTEIDAMTEEDATRGFEAELVDVAGNPVRIAATLTRFVTKGRVLALLMMRPHAAEPATLTPEPPPPASPRPWALG